MSNIFRMIIMIRKVMVMVIASLIWKQIVVFIQKIFWLLRHTFFGKRHYCTWLAVLVCVVITTNVLGALWSRKRMRRLDPRP